MTDEEMHVLKDAINAFNNKIREHHNKPKLIDLTYSNYEIYEISRYLEHQYRLLMQLHEYEQTILKYAELQNDLIIKK
jgi:hypothetical protein